MFFCAQCDATGIERIEPEHETAAERAERKNPKGMNTNVYGDPIDDRWAVVPLVIVPLILWFIAERL